MCIRDRYDIYIGQDIAPDIPFDLLYLKNIRLWQLTATVEVARLTNNLVSQMPMALLTTQLIFIHSNPIDISCRNDAVSYTHLDVYKRQ